MLKQIDITLSPVDAQKTDNYTEYASKILKISKNRISYIKLVKHSIDARQRDIKVQLRFVIVIDEPNYKPEKIIFEPKNVTNSKEVAIIAEALALEL